MAILFYLYLRSGKSSPNDVVKFKEFLSDPFVEGDEIILNYHRGESDFTNKLSFALQIKLSSEKP